MNIENLKGNEKIIIFKNNFIIYLKILNFNLIFFFFLRNLL
jgi:hypothetical protein